MKIKVNGSAKIKKDGSILLTDDLHQSGRVTFQKVNILDKPWKLTAIVSMSDNKGLSDEDGQGGDGIWFEFNERQFSIGLDTFQNEYNDSGNEIDLFIEGQIIAKQHCSTKFNSGKKIKIEIFCKPNPQTIIGVSVNGKVVLTHVLQKLTLNSLFSKSPTLSLFGFTGDASSKQIVHSLELKNIEFNVKGE